MADMEAVKKALSEVMALVNESDGAALKARRPAPPAAPEAEEEAPAEECADCLQGECLEHPKEDDVSALEAALSK